MKTPTTPPKLMYDPDERGGYAVRLGDTVIGHVVRSPINPTCWDAYPDAERTATEIVAQRSTREHAAQALVLHLQRQAPAEWPAEAAAVGATFPTAEPRQGLRLVWDADRAGGQR